MTKQTATLEKPNGIVETATDEFGSLRSDIERLRSDLAALSKDFKGVGSAALTEAQRVGADKIEAMRGEVERTAQWLRKQGAASMTEVEHTIQQRPILSLLAAFGAGMLITRLMERR